MPHLDHPLDLLTLLCSVRDDSDDDGGDDKTSVQLLLVLLLQLFFSVLLLKSPPDAEVTVTPEVAMTWHGRRFRGTARLRLLPAALVANVTETFSLSGPTAAGTFKAVRRASADAAVLKSVPRGFSASLFTGVEQAKGTDH